jgi:hypothetical protein
MEWPWSQMVLELSGVSTLAASRLTQSLIDKPVTIYPSLTTTVIFYKQSEKPEGTQ